MFATLIAATLAFEPIPKASHEGRIIVVNLARSELVIFHPSGKLEKTISLKDIHPDIPERAKFLPDGNTVCVTCSVAQGHEIVGKRIYPNYSGYLIDLNGESKPKKIIPNTRTVFFHWILSRDGSTAFVAKGDEDKLAKAGSDDSKLYPVFQRLNLKTNQSSTFDLPEKFQFNDMIDDNTILGSIYTGKSHQLTKISIQTKQPEMIKEIAAADIPCGAQVFTSDRLKIASYNYFEDKRPHNELVVYDTKNKRKFSFENPEGLVTLGKMSFSPDGKQIAYIGVFGKTNGFGLMYRLYLANVDGSNKRIIHEWNQGENMISYCDWR